MADRELFGQDQNAPANGGEGMLSGTRQETTDNAAPDISRLSPETAPDMIVEEGNKQGVLHTGTSEFYDIEEAGYVEQPGERAESDEIAESFTGVRGIDVPQSPPADAPGSSTSAPIAARSQSAPQDFSVNAQQQILGAPEAAFPGAAAVADQERCDEAIAGIVEAHEHAWRGVAQDAAGIVGADGAQQISPMGKIKDRALLVERHRCHGRFHRVRRQGRCRVVQVRHDHLRGRAIETAMRQGAGVRFERFERLVIGGRHIVLLLAPGQRRLITRATSRIV